MQSTISIFEDLYKKIPPLVPSKLKQKMEHALNHLKNDQTVTLEEVEDTMITFGYEVWPWNQAYREFLSFCESKVGEHFLLPKLNKSTEEKYNRFVSYGGSFRELHSGRPAEFFTLEERKELSRALVETQKELREFTDREILGTEKNKYLKKVKEFSEILGKINDQLKSLRTLADSEQDHPVLADQIRARVRSFEYSLCLLGPELEYHAVDKSLDYFSGRKHELNQLRGIHLPVYVNFFD